ncbi:MAG: aminotransferase class V-fold PLP-dependent enzyme [Candidatus Hodarchaeota archaeon]
MSVDWEDIRHEQFPALKNLVYIMAASASPLSKSAYEKGIAYFNDMLSYGDIHYDDFVEEIDLARENIAYYINAEPDEIAFLTNTSSGMNVTARLLEKGEILYPSIEFPASIHIFKRLGFICKKVSPRNNKFLIEDFKKLITRNTKYIIHSHVQSLTGFKQNLNELGDFCEEYGLLNIVNATQSFCSFEIDVIEQNIDIIVSNALKWVGCGYGAGILYINEDLIKEKGIPFSSWLSVEDPFSLDNENMRIINKTRYMDALGGCPNFAALLSLKGGLDLVKNNIGNGNIKNGVKRIQDRIILLTNKFLDEIKNLNYRIITPLEIQYRSGIITLEHEKAEEINDHLVKNKIYVTLKKDLNTSKNTLLRFAFNYYNNFEDITKVVNQLRKY